MNNKVIYIFSAIPILLISCLGAKRTTSYQNIVYEGVLTTKNINSTQNNYSNIIKADLDSLNLTYSITNLSLIDDISNNLYAGSEIKSLSVNEFIQANKQHNSASKKKNYSLSHKNINLSDENDYSPIDDSVKIEYRKISKKFQRLSSLLLSRIHSKNELKSLRQGSDNKSINIFTFINFKDILFLILFTLTFLLTIRFLIRGLK